MLTPWDIPAPNADNPGAKIIQLRRVPVRASRAVSHAPEARRVSDPDAAYADAILDEVGGYVGLAVMLLVVVAIGAMLAIGTAL